MTRDSSFIVLLSSAIFFVLIQPSALLRLNKNGGYDLSIAIAEDTPRPDYSPVLYFNKVRLVAQTLSNGMWYVTNKTFFINSVELMLPQSWDNVVHPATTQSYEEADVRVSNKFQYLRTENPNLCGLPGQFIETPRDFFDNTGYTSSYGTPWKALFTQWARYRWGIWEEHGYPGDGRFPYFYRKPGSPGWSVTGCSDVTLEGEYRTIDNKTCRADGKEYPGDDCRFYPDWEHSPARTSIMHFHWIENVAQLCDESNHDAEAPNRQNRNCGHKSSWEVIRESPDFKYANEARPLYIPTLEINVVRRSTYPRLLVLLDKGTTQVSHELRLSVQAELATLFRRGQMPAQAVAKIANFPVQNSTTADSSGMISSEVEWSYFEENLQFLTALNSTKSANPNREDFGLAIQSAVDECKNKNNPAGCILVVVKTGWAKSIFDKMAYQVDTVISLKEDPRVKLFAIELVADENEPEHLRGLAAAVGGRHVRILTEKDVKNRLEPIVNEILGLFSSTGNALTELSTFQNVYRGLVEANTVQEIPTIVSNADFLEFRLTSRVKLDQSSIFMEPLGVPSYDKIIISPSSNQLEWGEDKDSSKRYLYSATVTERILANAGSWRVYIVSGKSTSVLLNVYANRTLISSNDTPDDGITFSLSTSLNDIDVDDSAQPLAIYLSAHKLGQPVNKLTVRATVHSYTTGESWELPLIDDGLGDPDIYPKDGIYSGSFLPTANGNYQVYAYVKNSDCAAKSRDLKLVLPDQGNIGCFPNAKSFDDANSACAGTIIQGKYSKLVASRVLRVRNARSSIAGKPFRILDLEASEDKTTGIVALKFAAPKLFGSNNKATSYAVYYGDSLQKLVRGPEPSAKIGEVPANSAGTLEYLLIQPGSSEITYYAVEATHDNVRSGLSNIVSVKSTSGTHTSGRPLLLSGNETLMPLSTKRSIYLTEPALIVGVILANVGVIAIVVIGMVILFKKKIAETNTEPDSNGNGKV